MFAENPEYWKMRNHITSAHRQDIISQKSGVNAEEIYYYKYNSLSA